MPTRVLRYAPAPATGPRRRERTARRPRSTARALRYAGSLLAERARRPARATRAASATSPIRWTMRSGAGARTGCHRGAGRSPQRRGRARQALGNALVPGRHRRLRARGLEAVEVLEGLEPGRELALAYANLTTFELALQQRGAVRWASTRHRARGAARRQRDPAHRPCQHPQARPRERRPGSPGGARRSAAGGGARRDSRARSRASGSHSRSGPSSSMSTTISIATSKPGSPIARSAISRCSGATCTLPGRRQPSSARAGARPPKPRRSSCTTPDLPSSPASTRGSCWASCEPGEAIRSPRS